MSAPRADALTGNQKLAVVLCNFRDNTSEPHDAAYYLRMFSEAGRGLRGAYDYWKEVSYNGRGPGYTGIDLTGSVVVGNRWYTVNKTWAEFMALSRPDKVDVCATAAKGDVSYGSFAGVVVLTNVNTDLFGAGPATRIDGTVYPNLGKMVAAAIDPLTGILHETGHALGVDHARTLRQQYDPFTPVGQAPPAGAKTQNDYGDPYDVGSCYGCYGAPSYQGNGPPGPNAVQLDIAGWIPAGRELRSFDNSTCRQVTSEVAALNHPEASGVLELRIPAVININHATESATTDYYAVEFRHKSGWDAGIPQSTVLLHLHGRDTKDATDERSYWVDSSGIAGTYYSTQNDSNGYGVITSAGSEYVDSARKAFVAVNAIRTTSPTAVVTIGSCKIKPTLTYTGDTRGDFNDTATLAADLTVGGAPIPNQPVTLSMGTQSCSRTSDAAGHVSCVIIINQHPATVNVGASFDGDNAYEGIGVGRSFTIDKEESQVTYTGPATSDYHDAFTATAVLVDPDGGAPILGKQIQFTVGTSDTCGATTSSAIDTAGVASCSITPNQVPGSYNLVAAFAGDIDYEPSTATRPFSITKEQTNLAYTGPTTIANGEPFTFAARLTEDDPTPVSGRHVVFSLGSGASAQSCTAAPVTDSAGIARCTVTPAQPLDDTGTLPIVATFSGDSYYLPSTSTATVKLQHMTGRAFGVAATSSVAGIAARLSATPDTGSVRTPFASNANPPCTAMASLLGILSANTSCATVVTWLDPGRSTATASLADATIGVPGVPVITAQTVKATSTVRCGASSGSSTSGVLKIGGVPIDLSTVKPNTVVTTGSATIVLNEQLTADGADHRQRTVNAAHVLVSSALVKADIVLASAAADIHNCL